VGLASTWHQKAHPRRLGEEHLDHHADALLICFDDVFLREPVSTSLESAIE
jgi:hypothetical protein